MKNSSQAKATERFTLSGLKVADLMTTNPMSIEADATVKEAVAFLTDKGFSAAPVIDAAGRPIGVLSRTDILIHDREKVYYAPGMAEGDARAEPLEAVGEKWSHGYQVELTDRTQVRDIMTPVVFTVTPETPVEKMVADLLGLKVHRLFVVDKDGVLVGLVSALDIVRHLFPMQHSVATAAAPRAGRQVLCVEPR